MINYNYDDEPDVSNLIPWSQQSYIPVVNDEPHPIERADIMFPSERKCRAAAFDVEEAGDTNRTQFWFGLLGAVPWT